ncbi:hypothetical protein F2Q69_00035422 [Brassica cretica]|uniref:Uncharacterized protein n=1 Tax=Brassica cretica TaxID=69181 RepID=A0A8S9SRR8_BRACR|nr:hypothetical protein F2Q69_00035422 [Brassica cretica]
MGLRGIMKSSIGVPHGVLGDIWVHLELKKGDKGDHWTSSAWERHREVAVTPFQSDLTGATQRGRSRLHHPERRDRSDTARSQASPSPGAT